MPKVSTFAQRLQELIDVKQISKAQLARDTGIDKSSITHYVKGDWEGKQDAVYSIAVAMNVSEAWLMGYDVPMERVDDAVSDRSGREEVVGYDVAQNEDEQAMLLLARHMEPLEESKRKELQDHLRQSVDFYLKAMGLSGTEDE